MTRRPATALLLLALLASLCVGPARPARAATAEIFERVDGSFVAGPDVSKVQDVAQSFNATANYRLLRIDAMLYDLDPSNPLNLTIETEVGGVPSGAVVGSAVGDGVAGYAWTTFDFGAGVNLTAGTTYWIVLQDPVAMNQPNGYKWALKSPDQYPDGHYAIRSGGGAWIAWTDGDLLFRNWGLRGPQIAAAMSVDSATAGILDPLTYAVYFNNTGTGVASTVWANLTLSPNTTFDADTSASEGGIALGPLSWQFNDVSIGPHSFQVSVHVNSGIFDGLRMEATATIAYANETRAFQEETVATAMVTARTPSLTVAKAVNPGSVSPDENLTYTITIVNSGSRSSRYVWLNDTLPLEVTYVADTANSVANYTSGGFDGTVLHANFTYLPRGTFSFDILARTRPGLDNGTGFTNVVSVDYTDRSGLTRLPRVVATATAHIHGASIAVGSAASVASAEPGQSVRYRLHYDNLGDAIARWVWINDTFAAEAEYIADSGGGVLSGSMLRFIFANVSVGPHSVSVDVRIRNGTPDGTIVRNVAALAYADWDGSLLAPSTATTDVLAVEPRITVVAAGVPVADPGDSWSLALTVRNGGNASAADLWLNLTVPPQLVRVSDDAASIGATPTPDGWYFGDVPSGALPFTVLFALGVGLADGTSLPVLVDGAFADGLGRIAPVPQATVPLVVSAPAFTLELAPARGTVSVGEEEIITVAYVNVGTGTASDVWINVTIPDGNALVSASEPWSLTTGYRYTWHLQSVAPGPHDVILTIHANAVLETGRNTVSAVLEYRDANGHPAGNRSAEVVFQTVGADLPAQSWVFIGGLLAVIGLLSAFVGRRIYGVGTRERAQILQLFLLHKSGLLIKHYTRALHGTLDTDLLAAMLVAVQNLVRESFRFKAGDLEELKFGPHELLLAHGENVILAALVTGSDSDRLKAVLAAGVMRLERDYGARLVDWSGVVDDFHGMDGLLDDILRGRTPYRATNGNGRGRVGPP